MSEMACKDLQSAASLQEQRSPHLHLQDNGEMAEWLKALVLKTSDG